MKRLSLIYETKLSFGMFVFIKLRQPHKYVVVPSHCILPPPPLPSYMYRSKSFPQLLLGMYMSLCNLNSVNTFAMLALENLFLIC